MKRSYWEKMAESYSDEIFDVLQNDKKALIRSAIKKYASKSKTVADIGCAIGKWLPVLSPLFKKVYAIDISKKNLEIARQLYPQYKNVEYIRADMSSGKTGIPKCDAGICINAILTPSLKDRMSFLKSLSYYIKKGGNIIITVPSMESYIFTHVVQNQWKIDRQYFPSKIPAKEAVRKWNNIKQGNADIDDVSHKHFLEEELELLLTKEGFTIERIEKIEYSWDTEFYNPPKWLKKPGPWDWMVVAKRK